MSDHGVALSLLPPSSLANATPPPAPTPPLFQRHSEGNLRAVSSPRRRQRLFLPQSPSCQPASNYKMGEVNGTERQGGAGRHWVVKWQSARGGKKHTPVIKEGLLLKQNGSVLPRHGWTRPSSFHDPIMSRSERAPLWSDYCNLANFTCSSAGNV